MRRVPTKKYITGLERRVEGLEKLLRQLCPEDQTFEEWLEWLDGGSDSKTPRVGQSSLAATTIPVERITRGLRAVGNDNYTHLDDESDGLAKGPNIMNLGTNRFFGMSSGEVLAYIALKTKHIQTQYLKQPVLRYKREEFWTRLPWERTPEPLISARYNFPEPDFAAGLVELYFDNVNSYLPLLHGPSFRRSVLAGLQHINDDFAAIYLLVCAVGSKFSTDSRVLLPGFDSYHSAGWKWFNETQALKTRYPIQPCLYDLQFYCLSIIFLQCSSAPQPVWAMIGIAFRLAQEVGAHRRKTRPNTVEGELWKRAFWVLLSLDRTISVALGRPCAIQEEDYDLDTPIDCDDEYWENPDPPKRFKQPSDKPSLILAFILHLQLTRIMAYCIRGIYSLSKMNAQLCLKDQQWKSRIVAELDSSLNKWFASVPEHLRWDPNREHDKFFSLSGMLHVTYYHIRILIHIPFIPLPNRPSSLSLPSLAICKNAARAGCSVAYTCLEKNVMPPLPNVQIATYVYGVVLLFDMWGRRKPGSPPEWNNDMEDIYRCLHIFKAAEARWHHAGKVRDVLSELAFVDLPAQGQEASNSTSTPGRRWSPSGPSSSLSQTIPQTRSQNPNGGASIMDGRWCYSCENVFSGEDAVASVSVAQSSGGLQSYPDSRQALLPFPISSAINLAGVQEPGSDNVSSLNFWSLFQASLASLYPPTSNGSSVMAFAPFTNFPDEVAMGESGSLVVEDGTVTLSSNDGQYFYQKEEQTTQETQEHLTPLRQHGSTDEATSVCPNVLATSLGLGDWDQYLQDIGDLMHS
ncbi:unnamed protein product [Cyclocybe aegerita]|uniref:Xylanolytic transcriptional activator regulatory domain-containing protein n=1 Tax=Cyclocybe aegerita TaxID=1973307 RepID=A0A8S0X887_CYCAE|nr:unnamed protein product [Cyclocybe aegerita]